MSQRDIHKLVVRRLPPLLTQAAFEQSIAEYREQIDWLFYSPGKKSQLHKITQRMMTYRAARADRHSCAQLNFKNEAALIRFMREFHGHAFIDSDDRIDYAFCTKALFQRVPKKEKLDAKQGLIDEEQKWRKFLSDTEANAFPQKTKMPVKENEADKSEKITPLLRFLRDQNTIKVTARKGEARASVPKAESAKKEKSKKDSSDVHISTDAKQLTTVKTQRAAGRASTKVKGDVHAPHVKVDMVPSEAELSPRRAEETIDPSPRKEKARNLRGKHREREESRQPRKTADGSERRPKR